MATTVTRTLVGSQWQIVVTESSAAPGSLNNWADQVGSRGIRVTQEFLEVVAQSFPNARVTQEFLEVVVAAVPNARITQLFLEVVAERSATQPRVWIMT